MDNAHLSRRRAMTLPDFNSLPIAISKFCPQCKKELKECEVVMIDTIQGEKEVLQCTNCRLYYRKFKNINTKQGP